MANNKYNFLRTQGERCPIMVTGETSPKSIDNTGLDYLTYAASYIAPWNITLNESNPDSIQSNNWGQYDQPGIKRMHSGINNSDESLNTTQQEGVMIHNHSPQSFSIFGYFGDNFNSDTAVEPSEENPNDGVGYWMEIMELPRGYAIGAWNGTEPTEPMLGEAMIPWFKDQYGNQMERMYFYAPYTGQHYNEMTQAQQDSINAAAVAEEKVTDYQWNIYVGAHTGDALNLLENSLFFTDLLTDTVSILDNRQYGMAYLQSELMPQTGGTYAYNKHEEMEQGDNTIHDMVYVYNESEWQESFNQSLITDAIAVINSDYVSNLVIRANTITNYDEEGFQSDMTDVLFEFPASINDGIDKLRSIAIYAKQAAGGVIGGSVEGSFLSGATVTGKDVSGVEMTAITNSNGYYEFPRPAYGEIKAEGGTNEITGENYEGTEDVNEVEIVTQDLVTNSELGGILSPVSTLIIELTKNEGFSKEEAINILADQGQELFDLPSSLADKAKIKEYMQLGLNGLQSSAADDLESYAGFLQLSKTIAEQEQLFVDTNFAASTQKRKKKRAADDYRQSLTRFMKRKDADEVSQYKSDYYAKVGTVDTNIAVISDTNPSQKEQFEMILADAVEKVDLYISENERLASSKADLKLRSKEMMEETIDNKEVISTSGKSYEDVAIELNEKYMIRKMAAREEQVSRYNTGVKRTFSTAKSSQNFQITKTSQGYERSGQIIKNAGNPKSEISSGTKTRSTFLDDTKVAKFVPIVKVGDNELKLEKSNDGEIQRNRRTEEGESEQSTAGVTIKNPNYVIIEVGAPGFRDATEFGGNSSSYTIQASSGIKMKGNSPSGVIVYNIRIEDSNEEVVRPSYDNSLEFRRVANAFVELYSVHGVSEVQETEVYEYLDEYLRASVDTDGDGVIDSLDAFPSDSTETRDSDGDGVGDNADAFPNDASETADSDGDGVGDNADAFPSDPTETTDSDGDGVGDNADAFPNDASETADSDGDGVGDNEDDLPNDPTETVDTDGDGTGDNADTDDDNDTHSDEDEIEAGTDPKDSESFPDVSEISPQERQENELTKNLKGFFTTNESASYSGTGTTINEVSGAEGGTNGTLRNGVSYVNDDTSVNVPYLVFDGVDDHFNWAHNPNVKLGIGNRGPGMTYSVWIKPNAKTAHIMNNDAYGTSYYYGVNFGFYSDGRIFTNEMNQGHPQRKGKYNRDLTLFGAVDGQNPLTDAMTNGSWVHVCVTYTDFGGGRNKALYINGQLWKNMANGNGFASNYRRYVDYTTSNGGSVGIMGASTAYYSGGLESVKIFEGPLSAEDVAAEFNARKGLFNLGGEEA